MSAFEANADTVQLRHVRLHGAADGLRARLRFEAALAGFDPSFLSLPSKSLLIINHLAPTTRLRLDRYGVAEGFGQAVQSELERTARIAQRPWINPATTNAEAVLFSDEAELIACLLRDWLQGSITSRWWWPVVLEGLPVSEWWRRNLLPRGDVLPAVLAHLATRRQAVAWIKQLREPEVAQAIVAIITAHAMTSLAAWLSAAPTAPVQQTKTQIPKTPNDSCQGSMVAYQHLVAAIPESQTPTLSVMQRRLLVLALGLQRSPAWTRSSGFVAALQFIEADFANVDDGFSQVDVTEKINNSLDSVLQDTKTRVSGLTDKPQLVIHSTEQLDKSYPEGEGWFTTARMQEIGQRREQLPSGDQNSEKSLLEIQHSSFITERGAAGILSSSALPTAVSRSTSTVDDPTAASMEVLPTHDESFSPLFQEDRQPIVSLNDSVSFAEFTAYLNNEPAIQLQQAIETQYGGIFYLLNVALALGLYGDFTQPRHPSITLPPWDWLALIGRAWFGEDFQQDALWPLLAGLAGRSVEAVPGSDFFPPDTWTVPDEWLKPWGDPKYVSVYATKNRLQMWHEAGFELIDAARIAGISPLAQARQFCSQSEVLSATRLVRINRQPQQIVLPITEKPKLNRWLGWVLWYLLSRLQRALGVDAPDALTRLLCCHVAQVDCTATAIDVHLSLAALPIEIRVAGLDRDPGWIPAAGRSIAFHFE
jgi:hypothetical protein